MASWLLRSAWCSVNLMRLIWQWPCCDSKRQDCACNSAAMGARQHRQRAAEERERGARAQREREAFAERLGAATYPHSGSKYTVGVGVCALRALCPQRTERSDRVGWGAVLQHCCCVRLYTSTLTVTECSRACVVIPSHACPYSPRGSHPPDSGVASGFGYVWRRVICRCCVNNSEVPVAQ